MSAAANAWPAIIGHHPGLAEDLAKGQARQWSLYPLPALCSFLARVEQRFPRMWVSTLRPLACPFTGEYSIVVFRWKTEAILAAGLLAPEQVPQGRKRVCMSNNPFSKYAHTNFLSAYKRAGGDLEIRVNVPPDVPVQHPLAFFRPASVRGSAQPRPALRLVVDNTRRVEQ